MASRPALFLACLAAATALAGCSGGGGADGAGAYPEAYILGTYGVPDGYVLLDSDSDEWAFAEEEFGMESNPGYADVDAIAGENDSIPIPDRLYVAMYVEEDSGQPDGEGSFGFILSFAATWEDQQELEDALETGGADDMCEGFEESEGGEQAAHALRDGNVLALLMTFDPAAADDLQQAADEMAEATGAEPLC